MAYLSRTASLVLGGLTFRALPIRFLSEVRDEEVIAARPVVCGRFAGGRSSARADRLLGFSGEPDSCSRPGRVSGRIVLHPSRPVEGPPRSSIPAIDSTRSCLFGRRREQMSGCDALEDLPAALEELRQGELHHAAAGEIGAVRADVRRDLVKGSGDAGARGDCLAG